MRDRLHGSNTVRATRGVFLLFLIAVYTSFGPSSAYAQPKGRPTPNLQNLEQLDPEDGIRVLQQIRKVGLAGDFIFEFRLIHRPKTGDESNYSGTMIGTWNGALQTRTELYHNPASDKVFRLLQHNGPHPRIWKLDQDADESIPTELKGIALHQPFFDGITFSPFELQMPFLYWNDFVYEGTKRVKGRPAHLFLLYPPESDGAYPLIGAVRAVIDADFNIVLRAEILDHAGNELKSLSVQSFKKVDEQWIIRRVDLIDEQTKDRTRFEIFGAALGLDLPNNYFLPENLSARIQLNQTLQFF
mgnify:CR=1 FL=1